MVNRALEEDTDDGEQPAPRGRGARDNTVDDEAPTLEGPPRPKSISYTRGMNIRAATGWLRDRHGDDGVAALAQSLPSETLRALGGPAMRPSAMTWVPFLAHAVQLEHIDALFGRGDLSLLLEVGRGMAVRDFPAIARPIAAFMSPGFFLDITTRIWGLYHTHGTWEISRGTRDLQGLLLDRPEHHPAFCMAMRGWVEGALLFCGAVDVTTHEERCATKGAQGCSYRMQWREKRDAATARDRQPRPPT